MTDLAKLEKELMNPENFPQRFKFARLRAKESHGSLGKQMGKSSGMTFQWEEGNNGPSMVNLKKACEILGVNVAWMKSGVGEMMAPKGDPEKPKLAEVMPKKTNGAGPDGMDLTARLKFARDRAKVSVKQIAEGIGMGLSTVGFYFLETDSKNYRKPSEETLGKIARFLKVKPLWLESGIGKVSWEPVVEKEPEEFVSQHVRKSGEVVENSPELLDAHSPAAKYFPDVNPEVGLEKAARSLSSTVKEEVVDVKVATVPKNALQETSMKLTALIAERDEHLAMAEMTQLEIDRLTAVLLSQVNM